MIFFTISGPDLNPLEGSSFQQCTHIFNAPISEHYDNEVDHFHEQLQETTKHPEDWDAKLGKDAQAD